MSTQDALPVAKRWLETCVENHKTCHSLDNMHTPTRLLHLSGKELRLSLASERVERVDYATLSHCWGSLPFQTLKKSNLNDFRQSIPPEALPKTFQDAIHTARCLGLEYLWIDSLCIIQDDDEDWRKEASLMSSVYGGSSINISASNATDGRFGCFQKRDSSWRCQVLIDHANPPLIYDCIPSSAYRTLLDSPLATRGWVLQERVLSRRNLHFTKKEIFWECEESVVCETFPEVVQPLLDGYFRLIHRPIKMQQWPEIIEQYSRCKLTYSKDKLIAVSGLARIVHKDCNDEYVAGMWRQNLEMQLPWYTYTPAPRLSPYAAPSWSWASSRSQIHFLASQQPHQQKLLATVQDYKAECVSPDLFGELRSANLRLCCEYLVCAIIKNCELYPSVDIDGKPCGIDAKFDCLDIEKEKSIEAYILPIVAGSGEPIFEFLFGVLVVPTGKAKGQYQRIGQFGLIGEERKRAFSAFFKQYRGQLDNSEFVEVKIEANNIKRYVTDII